MLWCQIREREIPAILREKQGNTETNKQTSTCRDCSTLKTNLKLDYKPSYFWNKKHIKKAAFTGIVILLKKKLGSAIQVIFLFAQLPLEWPTYLGVTYTSRTLIQKCY